VGKNFFALMNDTGMKEQYMKKAHNLECHKGSQINPGEPLDPFKTIKTLFASGQFPDQSRRFP
jgi:hypothetical protein